MRLIDADDLYRKVLGYQDGAVDKSVAKRLIEQTPSADVRENIRGEWEQVEVNYFADMDDDIKESMAMASMFCPVCKRYHNEVYLYGDPTYGVNFCPHCGADMRGKQDDNE